MKGRHKRLGLLALGLTGLTAVTALVLNAMQGNLSYFFSPSQIIEGEAPVDRTIRVGGLVEAGSVKRSSTDLTVNFIVSDGAEKIDVSYTGILPDLFKEGQGVIAQGRLDANGTFLAQEVLAKHDENYMPPEVQEALDKGHAKGVAELAAKQQADGMSKN